MLSVLTHLKWPRKNISDINDNVSWKKQSRANHHWPVFIFRLLDVCTAWIINPCSHTPGAAQELLPPFRWNFYHQQSDLVTRHSRAGTVYYFCSASRNDLKMASDEHAGRSFQLHVRTEWSSAVFTVCCFCIQAFSAKNFIANSRKALGVSDTQKNQLPCLKSAFCCSVLSHQLLHDCEASQLINITKIFSVFLIQSGGPKLSSKS